MLSPVLVAGIDAGKHFLDLGFHPTAKPMRCVNNPTGIKRLIATLRQRSVTRVALEANGPYAQPLMQALVAAGLTVALIDPRRVKDGTTLVKRLLQGIQHEARVSAA